MAYDNLDLGAISQALADGKPTTQEAAAVLRAGLSDWPSTTDQRLTDATTPAVMDTFTTGARRGNEGAKPDFTLIDWRFVMSFDFLQHTIDINDAQWLDDMLATLAIVPDGMPLGRVTVQMRLMAHAIVSAETSDSGQPRLFGVWTPDALRRYAAWMPQGAARYVKHNWRQGIPVSRYYRALLRHFMAWLADETVEQDSNGEWVGVDHFAAVIFNLCGIWWTLCEVEAGRLPKDLNDFDTMGED